MKYEIHSDTTEGGEEGKNFFVTNGGVMVGNSVVYTRVGCTRCYQLNKKLHASVEMVHRVRIEVERYKHSNGSCGN